MVSKLNGSLEITTKIGCINMCKYCPQSLLISEYSKLNGDLLMTFDTFKKCLSKVPKNVRIDFSGMAEPWLNPFCTKMLMFAHNQGYKIAVYTTLVGMSKEDWLKIKKIPFEIFMIHLPDNNRNAKINITKDYLELLSIVKKSNIKKIQYMTMGKINRVLKNDFGDLLLDLPMLSRSGTAEGVEKVFNKGPITCKWSKKILNHNELLPNGDVYLCCMDYGLKNKLGNLLIDSYKELFDKKYLRIKKSLKNGDDKYAICKFCEYACPDT